MLNILETILVMWSIVVPVALLILMHEEIHDWLADKFEEYRERKKEKEQ